MESWDKKKIGKVGLCCMWAIYVLTIQRRRMPYFYHNEEFVSEKNKKLAINLLLGCVGINASVNLFYILKNI